MTREESERAQAIAITSSLSEELGIHIPPPTKSKEHFSITELERFLKIQNIEIKYNEITQAVEILGDSIFYEETERKLSEDKSNDLLSIIHDYMKPRFKGVSYESIKHSLSYIGNSNRYNPVIEYLKSVKRDSKDYIKALTDDVLHLTDPFSKKLVIKAIIQAIALQYNTLNDSFGADGVLILQGSQGIGKTQFLRKLGQIGNRNLFIEGAQLRDGDKDSMLNCLSGFVCELGEIEKTITNENNVNFLKQFVTRTSDSIRKPYAPEPTKTARHTALFGTCNTDDFLKDTTGNRRFWVVRILGKIDWEMLTPEFVAQLWKQAQEIYLKTPNTFRLSESERDMLEKNNEQFTEVLDGEIELRNILEKYPQKKYLWDWMPIPDFLDIHYCRDLSTLKGAKIGRLLNKMHIEKKHTKYNNLYYLPTDDEL